MSSAPFSESRISRGFCPADLHRHRGVPIAESVLPMQLSFAMAQRDRCPPQHVPIEPMLDDHRARPAQ